MALMASFSWRALKRLAASRLLVLFVGICVIVFFCEVLIYYVVALQCRWAIVSEEQSALRALLVSDPHMLGPLRGHWLDRWRRERQMSAAFAAALAVHKPHVVFFLGDLFDEGARSREEQFSEYVHRFRRLFPVPADVDLFAVAGNHDMGFHHEITARRAMRFERELNAPPVRLVTLRGSHFVLLNSMAMEGDRCTLCRSAVEEITKLSKLFACSSGEQCYDNGNNRSRPILLQHFPLYRESDEVCSGPEAAPLPERAVPFRSRLDCLSREATDFLVRKLNPRAVFGGHTHHGCELRRAGFPEYSVPSFSWRNRPDPRYYLVRKLNPRAVFGGHTHHGCELRRAGFPEYSVPSFSWRNRPDPRYYLVTVTPEEVSVSKCALPTETTLVTTAAVSLALLLYAVAKYHYLRRRYFRRVM